MRADWPQSRPAFARESTVLELAEGLAGCCPDKRNMGPDFGANMFACHQSKKGAEIACKV